MDGKLKIMIVDDSETVRKIVQEELQSFGCVVCGYGTAEEGLQHLRKEEFDIVFIDQRLAGMDGLKMLAKIKEDRIKVIPIIITGYESPESVSEAIECGAFGYIIKPIQPLYLNATIKAALKRCEVEMKKDELIKIRDEQIKALKQEIARLKQK